MEREGQPNQSEIKDARVEAQETQPTPPEAKVEEAEKPLDGAQAEQMTVELQGELGNTANALLERAKQAGLAEDTDVQGLLGEFAQLSEQLNVALEGYKADVAKAVEGAAKIAAAHEAMPDIVGVEQLEKAQAGVEAARMKVAQGEVAGQALQAEQSRVQSVLEKKPNVAPDVTKEAESSVESIAGGLLERFAATKDALSDTFLKKMYEFRIKELQDVVDGKSERMGHYDLFPAPAVDFYLDANGQNTKQKEGNLSVLLGALREVVDRDGNVKDDLLKDIEDISPVQGIKAVLSELRESLDSAQTAGMNAQEWKNKRREIRNSVVQKYREALDRTKGALEASRTSARESEAFLKDSAIVESLKADTTEQVNTLKEMLAS